MKTKCPPGYHHNGFVVTHALGHMMYGLHRTSCVQVFTSVYIVHHVTVHHVPKCMSYHKAFVMITGRAHCFHDYIYITLILLL